MAEGSGSPDTEHTQPTGGEIQPPAPEKTITSPTEASKRWEVSYRPTLQQALLGTAGILTFAIGWSLGQADIEASKIAMDQGLFTLAAVKGLLGASEAIAGVSGAAAAIGWARKDQAKQLNSNPKP